MLNAELSMEIKDICNCIPVVDIYLVLNAELSMEIKDIRNCIPVVDIYI